MNLNLEELKKITILYVEDEKEVRDQIAGILQGVLKKVYVATDGKEGLSLFKEKMEEIDLIVSDINMPKITGLDMAEKILKINKHIPIIITTAYTVEEYLIKSIDINIYKYMTKPLKMKELTLNILEAYSEYKIKKSTNKSTEALVNKYLFTEKKANTLHKGFFSSQKKINWQDNIINQYICFLKLDKNGNITKVSDKFCSIYGYEKEEIIGSNISIICKNVNIIQKKMLETIRENKVKSVKDTFITKENKEVNLSCEFYPIKEDNENFINAFYLYQDHIYS